MNERYLLEQENCVYSRTGIGGSTLVSTLSRTRDTDRSDQTDSGKCESSRLYSPLKRVLHSVLGEHPVVELHHPVRVVTLYYFLISRLTLPCLFSHTTRPFPTHVRTPIRSLVTRGVHSPPTYVRLYGPL